MHKIRNRTQKRKQIRKQTRKQSRYARGGANSEFPAHINNLAYKHLLVNGHKRTPNEYSLQIGERISRGLHNQIYNELNKIRSRHIVTNPNHKNE